MRVLARSVTTRRGRRPPPAVLLRRWTVLVAALAALAIIIAVAVPSSAPKPHHDASRHNQSNLTGSSGSKPPAKAPNTAHLVATVPRWRLPSPVSRAVVLADGSDILVLGGLTAGDVSSAAVERLQPDTGVSGVAGELSIAVHDAAGAVLRSHFVVFGGGAGTSLASVQSWTPRSSSIVGSLPAARSDLSTGTIGSVAYVLGGFDGQSLQKDVLSTRDGVTFRSVGTLAQPVRYAAVASSRNVIWIVGGQLGTSESSSVGGQTNDIQVFDPATGTTRVIGHLPEPLGQAMAFDLGGQLYVAGGQSAGVPSPKIWLIEPNGTPRSAGTLPYAVSNAGAAVIGNTAWLLGGETTAGPSAPLKSVIKIQAAG